MYTCIYVSYLRYTIASIFMFDYYYTTHNYNDKKINNKQKRIHNFSYYIKWFVYQIRY